MFCRSIWHLISPVSSVAERLDKEGPPKLTWLARSMSLHPMFLKTSMMTSAGRLSMSIVAQSLSSKYSCAEIEQCCVTSAQRSIFNVQRSIFNGGPWNASKLNENENENDILANYVT